MKHIFTLLFIFAIVLNGIFFYSCNKTESSVPVAAFSVSQAQGETGQALQLVNEASADVISWRWYAPGSIETVSETKNPAFTYGTPGTYDVSLTVYNGRAHHSFTRKKCITITPQKLAPVAIFKASATKVKAGASIHFSDQSLHAPKEWQWSFPGATPESSTLQHPENIVYKIPGTYNVSLKAINEVGSHSSEIKGYITIKAPLQQPERMMSLFGKIYPLVKTGDQYQLASDVPVSYLLYATTKEEQLHNYSPPFSLETVHIALEVETTDFAEPIYVPEAPQPGAEFAPVSYSFMQAKP